MSRQNKSEQGQSKLRIAIVDSDRCKPKKCHQECKKSCPVNRVGKAQCIEVDKDSINAVISEKLCIGCGICVKTCPFRAISIINLPKDLSGEVVHRFGPNSFKLHRLPIPRPGQVLGIVGTNGIGKSTALSILAGRLMPNLGRFDEQPSWTDIISTFKAGELPSYFDRVLRGDCEAIVKPQYVDRIAKHLGGTVATTLDMKDKVGKLKHVSKALELSHLMSRNLTELSGGELQRFAIGLLCIQDAQIYMFDEPSSFLDVRQRLAAAHMIRGLLSHDRYIIVVEHDLSVLDYLSDFVCVLWGSAGAYGVVTMPFSVREGINIFLDGKIPTENLRFREVALTFKISDQVTEIDDEDKLAQTRYPDLCKVMGVNGFQIKVEAGHFCRSEIIVMLGQNGTGKTTFIRMLAGLLSPDGNFEDGKCLPHLKVSYKPQSITCKFQGTVRDLFLAKIGDAFAHPQFQADVAKPMLMDPVLDRSLDSLSGGELQRVALVLSLGRPADIYLIDEPSAYLDAEQRIVAARVIKQFILTTRASAFIVEHDFIMATYLADRVIVYDGQPGVSCKASAPLELISGMNQFLKQLSITVRRDPTNFRPRINKMDSVKDREQRESGQYFVLES